MASKLSVIFICFLAQLATGQTNYSPIVGAFGWRLGDQAVFTSRYDSNGTGLIRGPFPWFVDSKDSLTKVYRNGYQGWREAWSPWGTVFASTTDTRKVFRIGGIMFKPATDSHDAFVALKNGLAAKYGHPVAVGQFPPEKHYWYDGYPIEEWAKFTDGHSDIYISRTADIIDTFDQGCRIEIDYVSQILAEKAAQEKLNREHLIRGL